MTLINTICPIIFFGTSFTAMLVFNFGKGFFFFFQVFGFLPLTHSALKLQFFKILHKFELSCDVKFLDSKVQFWLHEFEFELSCLLFLVVSGCCFV